MVGAAKYCPRVGDLNLPTKPIAATPRTECVFDEEYGITDVFAQLDEQIFANHPDETLAEHTDWVIVILTNLMNVPSSACCPRLSRCPKRYKARRRQLMADFKLGSGGGKAAVRLNELKRLRAVAAPSADQRDRIAQLEAGEAADTQAVAD